MQIPDGRTGDDIIDAVVVDEEVVEYQGSTCGAKILYGKGTLDCYLSQQKVKDSQVCLQLLVFLVCFRCILILPMITELWSPIFNLTPQKKKLWYSFWFLFYSPQLQSGRKQSMKWNQKFLLLLQACNIISHLFVHNIFCIL